MKAKRDVVSWIVVLVAIGTMIGIACVPAPEPEQVDAARSGTPVVIQGGQLVIQVTVIDWTTTIRLPNWTPPDGTPQVQIDEWNRFRAALETHENGHRDISNTAFTAIRTALVNTPAGRITIADPGTPEAREAAINAAVMQLIEGRQEYQQEQTNQTNYDAPQTEQNPSGTNHGATQGATLNTNPQVALNKRWLIPIDQAARAA